MTHQAKFNEILLAHSEADNLYDAAKEWEVTGTWESPGNCLCGKDIKENFEITNVVNGNILSPVGNVCIRRFGSHSKNLIETLKSYERVRCDLCKIWVANKKTYLKHLECESHKKRIGFRPCVEENCTRMISEDRPDWCIRCVQCYAKHTNYISPYKKRQMESKEKSREKPQGKIRFTTPIASSLMLDQLGQ